ncbi:Alpha/Beta hydrolase protein [Aspergillus venezuelensis]
MRRFLSLSFFAVLGLSPVAALQGQFQELLKLPERRRVSGERWKLVEQRDEVCQSGSPHYTGTISITDHKSIGPGASSLIGMFEELGPCLVNQYGNGTDYNPHSWSNEFNVLFIDQPAGSGFSTASDPSEWPTTVAQSSPDFATTLGIFFSEIFPQYSTLPLYVAGESYGGKYVPRFLADIVKARANFYRPDTSVPPITGMILVDAGIASGYYEVGQFDMFCNGASDVLQFNQSVCDAMAKAVPRCEKLASMCRDTMEPFVCKQASDYCGENVGKYFNAEVWAGKHSPYDVSKDCPNPPSCLDFNSTTSLYLNTPAIQNHLELNEPVRWEPANFDLNVLFPLEDDFWLPSTPDLVYLLDQSSTRILAFAGDYDVIVNTPGTMRLFDQLPWSQQARFRAQPLENWYWVDEKDRQQIGGALKTHSRLTVAGVRGAGHMSPQDQRAPVLSLVANWILSVET